jgi:large subunit ribosomal protein L1
LLSQARSLGVDVISRDDLEPLAGNKNMARKLARKYDYFIAEAPLMALVGKVLGQFLAPRDRMPTPVPPSSDISSHISRLRSSVQVRLKTQGVMSTVIGTEDMPIEHLVENAIRVLTAVEEKLPAGRRNLKSLYFKTTMGKKVALEVGKHG